LAIEIDGASNNCRAVIFVIGGENSPAAHAKVAWPELNNQRDFPIRADGAENKSPLGHSDHLEK
jgi:hypothetical protein